MRRLVDCLTLVALTLSAARADAVSFAPLGDLTGGSFRSEAQGISADGSTVVGRSVSASGYEAFRWTSGGGMVGLGDLTGGGFTSWASGVSADGLVVVGQGISASGHEAFRWTSGGGMVGLGDLTGGAFESCAWGVSADGSVVVGRSDSVSGYEAFRWTSDGGMVGLGDLTGGAFDSAAQGVSANGLTVVGLGTSAIGTEAFRWTSGGGMVGLGHMAGGNYSLAVGVSADGSVVVGESGSVSGLEAFRWTSGGGMVGLGDLTGGAFDSCACDVSADGSVVVGQGRAASGVRASLWTPVMGMVDLSEFVYSFGDVSLDGWTLSLATAISDNGRVIVGTGTNPSSNTEAWLVSIESLPLCWTSTGSGSWDNAANWLFGFQPGAAGQDDVLIQPDYGLTVTGPQSTTTVTSVTVDAQTAGTAVLTIQDTGTLIVTGQTTIGPRGKLTGEGTLVATGGIDNDGEIDLGDGSLQIVGGTLTNTGLIRGDGEIDNTLSNTAAGELRVESGQRMLLTGYGITNSGKINVGAGTVELTGDEPINAGEINVGTGTVEVAQDLENTGEISLAGGRFIARNLYNEIDGFISGRGELRVENGLYNDGVMAFSGGFTDVHGDVTNKSSGQIVISGGSTTTFYDDVATNGEIRVGTGCSAVFFGGFTGTGGTTGPGTVYLEGDLRPGSSPAVVSFGGNLALGGAATVVIELYGTDPGEFDVVDVADTLSVDGTLDIRLMGEFTPALGNTFDILDWSTLGGEFDVVLLPGLESYLAWDTDDLYVTGEIAVAYLTAPGDANLDGAVDDKDASIVGSHWLLASGATWGMGDFDLDGKVNDQDAAILAAHWGYGTDPETAVPEPSTLALLAMGAVGLLLCIRRTRQQAIISETRAT